MAAKGRKIDHQIPFLVAVVLISACLCSLFGDRARPKETNRATQNNASVHSEEPFHTRSVKTPAGHLSQKWGPVAAAIRDELQTISLCSRTPDKCSSDGAMKFHDIIKMASEYEGQVRLNQINRAVNLAVKYTTDARKYGIPDHWATPFDTLRSGEGDCEDYAITKYALLRAMDMPASNLRIVLVFDTRRKEYHAVAATHLGRAWLILDNGRPGTLEDAKLANYHPLFIIDDSGVRTLYRPARADGSKILNWNRMQ
jgi:predicted transglutaminase-like cysteine proteinase